MPGVIKSPHLYSDFRTHRRQTSWGIGAIAPSMKKFFDSISLMDQAILIPGVGNAYEAVYLLENGFTNITIVDFSTGVTERMRTIFDMFLNKQIRIITVDFFEHSGSYDFIIE